MNLSAREFRATLRSDLSLFIHRAFLHLDPGTAYQHNWHIELIADRLEKVLDGSITRLIITVPPRSLKSICASVAFVAWALGHRPDLRFICASYGDALAQKHARDTASVMQSRWYQQIFDTRLDREATADLETTEQGGRLATSVGGPLTGRGGDIAIIDDPVKPDDALSDALREAANTWFENTLYSRLNDKRTGAIVIIQQRVHLDDLVGRVQEREGWQVINLPAIATEREEWRYHTPFGPAVHVREEGEALHPEREPLETLQMLRRNMGEFTFAAQYLQEPIPAGGALVKSEWLVRYSEALELEKYDRIVQSWDTANKLSEMSAYSVCTTWGVYDRKIYLLHVMRVRMDYPDLKRSVLQMADTWRAGVVLVEDKASGTQLVQELRDELSCVTPVVPKGDKYERMRAQTAQIANGAVLFPEDATWLPEYIKELMSFPRGRHSDQVDSTSQALEWFSLASRGPTCMDFILLDIMREYDMTFEEAREWYKKHFRKESDS